jgi:hypothetical protein
MGGTYNFIGVGRYKQNENNFIVYLNINTNQVEEYHENKPTVVYSVFNVTEWTYLEGYTEDMLDKIRDYKRREEELIFSNPRLTQIIN